MVGDKKKPWGGRFSEDLSTTAERISASVHFDARLWRQDIRGSMAHAKMLARIGILTREELDAILGGLASIEKEIEAGTFEFSPSLEDVHMNIEAALTARIGDAGRKLHTARSRNDQVATDMRLYLMDESGPIRSLITDCVGILADKASKEISAIMPGYTHLQAAQPVRFSHHLLTYAWGLLRDRDRLDAAVRACSLLPLGSGALAGLNYPVDREFVARELGFSGLVPNSMDAVSDRDFILDFCHFAAVCAVRLSRFSEEIILWSSPGFGFIRLSDAVTTGSSIMPQKRNPDVAELIRGKAARCIGNLTALLTLIKGLPMAYNRDLQEDKERVFDSLDTVRISLEGMREMLVSMEIIHERMGQAARGGFMTATDLADYLVRKGVPFRSSHEIVGRIVKYCEGKGTDLFSLSLEELKRFSQAFEQDALEAIEPEQSVERKISPGGTSRAEVERQIAAIKERLTR